ncbi:yos1-like protein [Ordospora pajunii]|jgi:hypothetical protein|uniref:yos1-like protein n=1 Tax=Ordospora pajunii TaxID=3039483 RepID=UPI00295284BA|nr:yos1-like protein [Ordospora pajunii]KAH9410828.1 yos1-like protein [Ordospora pajunii]
MFGIMTIAYGALFLLNAVVILDDRRFLSRVGLPLSPDARHTLGPSRKKMVELVRAVKTVTKIPLIILNTLCITYEIFLG